MNCNECIEYEQWHIKRQILLNEYERLTKKGGGKMAKKAKVKKAVKKVSKPMPKAMVKKVMKSC